MISPTVGRIVWYRPSKHDRHISGMSIHADDEPLAAIVTRVHADDCVNLAVFDTQGHHVSRTSVYLHQGDGPCAESPYCEWMPYQKSRCNTSAVARSLKRRKIPAAGT